MHGQGAFVGSAGSGCRGGGAWAVQAQGGNRFGVSISSAIRWTTLSRVTGGVHPRPVGGDQRSGRIEACAPVILQAVEAKPDITLVELRALLAESGVAVAVSSLWRFFARRKITVKKVCARRGAGPSRHPEAASGLVRRSTRSRPGMAGLHRRDRSFNQDGAASWSSSARSTSPRWRSPWPLEHDDLHRGTAALWHDCADGVGRTHDPRLVPRLCGAGSLSDASPRRRRHPRQPARPQGSRHPQRHRGDRRGAPLPAPSAVHPTKLRLACWCGRPPFGIIVPD